MKTTYYRRRQVLASPGITCSLESTNFQELTNCSKLSPHPDFLCFHALTNCPIRNFFVLITLQQYRGYGASHFPFSLFHFHVRSRHSALSPITSHQGLYLSAPYPCASSAACGDSSLLYRSPVSDLRLRRYFSLSRVTSHDFRFPISRFKKEE